MTACALHTLVGWLGTRNSHPESACMHTVSWQPRWRLQLPLFWITVYTTEPTEHPGFGPRHFLFLNSIRTLEVHCNKDSRRGFLFYYRF